MRPATQIIYVFLTGLFLTVSPSITFAQGADGAYIPPNFGQTVFAVTDNTVIYNSQHDPSRFVTLIDTGKTPYARYVSNIPNSNFTVFMSANKDPFINYQLSVTNNSIEDQFYMIAVGIPIEPLDVKATFRNDLTVTTSGSGPISLTPTYDGVNPSSGLQRELLSFDGGATFNAADEYGPLGTTITTAGTTVFPTFLQIYTNTPAYNYMELLVGFNLSPGTTATFDGINSIIVPEPSTLVMAFSAAFIFFVFHYRTRLDPRLSKVRA